MKEIKTSYTISILEKEIKALKEMLTRPYGTDRVDTKEDLNKRILELQNSISFLKEYKFNG